MSHIERGGLDVKFNIYGGGGHYFFHSFSQTRKVGNGGEIPPESMTNLALESMTFSFPLSATLKRSRFCSSWPNI